MRNSLLFDRNQIYQQQTAYGIMLHYGTIYLTALIKVHDFPARSDEYIKELTKKELQSYYKVIYVPNDI